ncbi:MAG: PVC-type heme-binding CxxCH protein, partial [Planctomycetota bacterium]
WASFLVGGGASEATRVELELMATDGSARTLFRTTGADFESMQRVVVDLSPALGKDVRVRLVDEATGGWGHLNFDDFRFHATRPSFPLVDGVPPILPPDPVLHAGLPPSEAAAAMSVPEGFRVALVASEPELHQPIALALDARGRLWVAEAFTYPQRAPEGAGQDDILVFTDADHDGRFETRTVFARGLNLVSGLEVGFGGVWVGAAPYLYFIPDRNDDLVPDGEPEVLLDGFGYQDTHETLNSFTWGPDGWLYGCHGVFTHSLVGQPGASDERRTPLNAGVWRYHPTRHEFELFAEGTSNPWGLDFDAQGQAFVEACVIPHFFHLAQGGRYLRQAGAHFEPYTFEDIDTIADHRHYLGDDPHGGNLRSNSAGGGHAHCGLVCYQADAFPAEWRGRFLMGNIHGNRINADRPERVDSGFVARHGPDFLLANDKWFRAINFELAPEGSLYLIDWYDRQACHWTAPEIWDRTNGRLYRVSYGRHVPLEADLTRLPSAELVRLLFHSNQWFARRARLLLQERGPEAEVVALLRRIVLEKGTPERALAALWALHAVAGLDERLTEELLNSPDAPLRAWTIQCALEDRTVSGALLDRLALLAMHEPAPLVRLYLASALQRLAVPQRFGLARALVTHGEDAGDRNLPLLLWYGIEPIAGAAPEQALVLARETKIPKLEAFLFRRLASEEATRAPLVEAMASEKDAGRRARMLDEFVSAVANERGLSAPRGWGALYPVLAHDGEHPRRARRDERTDEHRDPARET